MWIIFRLIAIPLAWLINKIVKSDDLLADNKQFESFKVVEVIKKRKNLEYATYYIKLNTQIQLAFKREGFLEGIFKAFGLSNDLNINHDRFDREIFIISDDPAAREILQTNQYQLAELILKLFQKYPYLVSINIKNQRLQLKTTAKILQEDWYMLQEIKAIIEQKQYSFDTYATRLHITKVVLIEGLIWFIASQAVIGIFEYFFQRTTLYLSIKPLIPLTFSLYLFLTISSFLLIKILLKKSSLIVLLLTELVLAIFFFYPIAALSIISDINIYLDQSQAQASSFVLMDKKEVISRGKRGSTTRRYFLIIAKTDQIQDQSQHVKIEVTSHLYDQASLGKQVYLWEKQGYFHIQFIDKIEVDRL